MNRVITRHVLTALATSALLTLSGCMSPSAAGRDADAVFASASDRPPTAATLYASAQLMLARGREDEAFWVYQRIVRDYPTFTPAYCGIAEHHVRHNRITDAAAAIRAGLAISPEDAILINNLGMCLMMQADHEQALAQFTKAASLTPGNARYRANMGAALGMMGRYDEAAAIYEQILGYSDAHHNVGVLAQSRGDKIRADQEFELAQQGAKPPTEQTKKDATEASKAAAVQAAP